MNKTLYDTIGKKGLEKLLDRFYDCVFQDPTISHLFQNSSREEVQAKQLLFIGQFLGGPQAYTELHGPPKMRQRHLPHKITPKGKEAWLLCMKNAISAQDWDDRLKEIIYDIFPPIANHMVNSNDES